MKKSPAVIDINLLPQDPFFSTPMGRVLQWALSAGRYIVIFTELIVILSFIGRFWLDRQLTDLNSSLAQKQQIISSFGTLEDDFRLAQKKIENYQLVSSSSNLTEVFQFITEVTPEDVLIDKLTISTSSVQLAGSTISQNSFNLLINNLQLSPHFFNVKVNRVEKNDDDAPGFKFSVNADTKEVIIQKTNTRNEVDRVNVLDRTQGL